MLLLMLLLMQLLLLLQVVAVDPAAVLIGSVGIEDMVNDIVIASIETDAAVLTIVIIVTTFAVAAVVFNY